jgi:hypothetical protein
MALPAANNPHSGYIRESFPAYEKSLKEVGNLSGLFINMRGAVKLEKPSTTTFNEITEAIGMIKGNIIFEKICK